MVHEPPENNPVNILLCSQVFLIQWIFNKRISVKFEGFYNLAHQDWPNRSHSPAFGSQQFWWMIYHDQCLIFCSFQTLSILITTIYYIVLQRRLRSIAKGEWNAHQNMKPQTSTPTSTNTTPRDK